MKKVQPKNKKKPDVTLPEDPGEVVDEKSVESTEDAIKMIKYLCRYIYEHIDEGFAISKSELIAHCKDDVRGEMMINLKVATVNTKEFDSRKKQSI